MSLAHRLLLSCFAALAAPAAIAEPLAADHPLIGTWKITAPNGCSESYVVRTDGTSAVTSNEEIAEIELALSARPSEKGFYKWVEKTVKDNGKKDCAGEITPIGRVVTNYVLIHPSQEMFAMCESEDRSTCVGPFKRIK